MSRIRTTLGSVSLAILAGGCAGSKFPGVAPSWSYQVSVTSGMELDVRARLPADAELVVDEEAMPYVSVLERSGTSVRYHVRLRQMAKSVADADVAIEEGGAIFAPPSSWLLRPVVAGAATFDFTVETPAGTRFETGVRPDGRGGWSAPASKLAESTFAAFGALRVRHVADPAFEVAIAPALPLADETVSAWLRDGVTAIGGYFGRPPDGRAVFFVSPSPTDPTRAKTIGDGGAAVLVRLGPKSTNATLRADWVAAHELVHVGFPRLPPRHAWFAEGLATYVEPIARARAGFLESDAVWKDFAENLPRGRKPIPLEGATDWDRVYWGGALYFLLADLRIRELTHDAKSLDDAVRAVVATGANVEEEWPLERVLDVGDAATGTNVLHELRTEIDGTDLPALYKRIGIDRERVDDGAPDAKRRRAITARR